MRLIRDIYITKLLYETFFDISNNFQDISSNVKNSSSHKGWFHPLEPFLNCNGIISKFIYLPSLHVYKVSLKSEFSSWRGSLVSAKIFVAYESIIDALTWLLDALDKNKHVKQLLSNAKKQYRIIDNRKI